MFESRLDPKWPVENRYGVVWTETRDRPGINDYGHETWLITGLTYSQAGWLTKHLEDLELTEPRGLVIS